MAGSTLTVERSGRVALVTFRRGDQLNAMNRQMQGEIIAKSVTRVAEKARSGGGAG
jgi:enoyl-CoA hydratase/carnithine racemase